MISYKKAMLNVLSSFFDIFISLADRNDGGGVGGRETMTVQLNSDRVSPGILWNVCFNLKDKKGTYRDE